MDQDFLENMDDFVTLDELAEDDEDSYINKSLSIGKITSQGRPWLIYRPMGDGGTIHAQIDPVECWGTKSNNNDDQF